MRADTDFVESRAEFCEVTVDTRNDSVKRERVCVNRPKFPGRRNVPGGRTWAPPGPRGRRAARGAALMHS
jgi:hypothetical protein